MREWIDISVPLANGMAHWADDPEPCFQLISEIEQGADANVTLCRMTAHTGTHMDAPCHFLAGGEAIDAFPLSVGIGPAKVISVPDVKNVGKAELAAKGIQKGDRILLRTKNSNKRWDRSDFQPDFAALSASGAEFLAEAGIVLIGVDYLSVGAFEGDGAQTHRILLGAGIWIVEGLNLREVAEGRYNMICLPINIAGSDGAPARVVLQPSTDFA